MGTALNLARILASSSAAEGACCASSAAEARSSVAGKRCDRRANVTESRNISRREVCFCKKLNFMFLVLLVSQGDFLISPTRKDMTVEEPKRAGHIKEALYACSNSF